MLKLKTTLLGGFIALGSIAFGQSSPFIPDGSTAGSFSVTKMTEKNSILADFFSGSMDGKKALGLRLVNTSTSTVNFSWTIKNKQGEIILTGKNITLAGGQMMSAAKSDLMAFVIGSGQQPSDFTVEITLK